MKGALVAFDQLCCGLLAICISRDMSRLSLVPGLLSVTEVAAPEDTKSQKYHHLKLEPFFNFFTTFSKIIFVQHSSNLESTRPLADYRIYIF